MTEMTLRPAEFFALMRARWHKPRERARDMRADEYGNELKRGAIDYIIAVDPDAEGLAAALAEYVASAGPHNGPLRGVCTDLLADWRQAQASPVLVQWLREGPDEEDEEGRRARRRQLRGEDGA